MTHGNAYPNNMEQVCMMPLYTAVTAGKVGEKTIQTSIFRCTRFHASSTTVSTPTL